MKKVFLIIFLSILIQPGLLCAQSAGPLIVTTPECLVFYTHESEGSPSAQKFSIANGQPSTTLNYTLQSAVSWLSIDKVSGTVALNKDMVTVGVNPLGLTLEESPYCGEITVINADDPEQKKIIPVRLSVLSDESYAKAYAYDQSGNLVRRINPEGAIIEYEYDSLNRLIRIWYPDGSSVGYSYDANGRRSQMSDSRGTTKYSYDQRGRVDAVYFPNINPVRYSYDKSGNIVKIVYPDESTVSYAYNSDNKLERVTDPTGITTYTYYSDTGLVHTKALPNGVVTTYTYDSAKRVTDVDNRQATGGLISTYHYAYDENSNIVSMVETLAAGAKTTSYTYDKLNRLKTVIYPDERGTVSYEYDPAGNRTKMVTPLGTTNYKYDVDNRLIRAGKEIFFYDKSGNLIKKVASGKVITYAYDYENRLIRYQDPEATVDYEYDGDGNRVAKVVNGVRTNYVNDILRNPVQVIMEANGSWHITKVYRYGLDRLSQEEF